LNQCSGGDGTDLKCLEVLYLCPVNNRFTFDSKCIKTALMVKLFSINQILKLLVTSYQSITLYRVIVRLVFF